MKKILLDSEELRMCVVSNNDSTSYTLAFDSGGGQSVDITRAQAYILAKTLVDDVVKGVQFFPPLAPAGPRIPVIDVETFESDLPHNV